MTRISIRTNNLKVVRQGLENFAGDVPTVGRRRLRTVTERIKRRLQEYPGERSGQSVRVAHGTLGTIIKAVRYRRTGNYGRGWVISNRQDGYEIRNDVRNKRGRRYARYVGGDAQGKGQAWMHKGRWGLFRTIVNEETARLPQEVSNDLSIAARKRRL